MEIKKGLNLSQFVELLGSERPFALHSEPDGGMSEMADDMAAVIQYNNFLKQPLKKEMFINEVKKPKESDFITISASNQEQYNEQWNYYNEALRKYEADEKKVIFKDFDKTGYIPDICIGHYKTLGDFFNATNGTLKLQNISL